MTTVATTDNKKTERTHLTDRQRHELQLKCLSYLAKGLSIAEIAEVEGITMWHARQILDRINQEARNSILSNMIAERVPMAVEVSLETNRLLIRKCMSIMYGSKDPRVQLQAAAQISSLVEKNNEILSQSGMIAGAIKRVLVVHPSTQPQLDEQEYDYNAYSAVNNKDIQAENTTSDNDDNSLDPPTTTTAPTGTDSDNSSSSNDNTQQQQEDNHQDSNGSDRQE